MRRLLGVALRARAVAAPLAATRLAASPALLATRRAFAAPPPPPPVAQAKMADSFADGSSIAYLEELEARFRENPASVDKSWANFFSLLGARAGAPQLARADALTRAQTAASRPSRSPPPSTPSSTARRLASPARRPHQRRRWTCRGRRSRSRCASSCSCARTRRVAQRGARARAAARRSAAHAARPLTARQVNGHCLANLDPLGLDNRPAPIELDPALYGFTEADLDKECVSRRGAQACGRPRHAPSPRLKKCVSRFLTQLPRFFVGTWRMSGFLSEDRPVQTLRAILSRLKQAYCGSVGYEYMHISDRNQCNWLRERIETATPRGYSKRRKLIMLDRLAWADLFEAFLSQKYSAAKRFGLEGAETLIPGMKELIDRAAELEVNSVVIGMPHRGRLNVLANVVRKPLEQIFSEFSSGVRPAVGAVYTGSGDVKYHLGTSYDRPTLRGSNIHLSLVANPSHLEAVNTVVQGKVRAKQYYDKDVARARTLPLLLHGDGAFAGQGIVYESLDMSQLPDYTVGGTVHIVVNNQVAFTTDPKFSRSSPYCTDVAKGLGAPVLHVNGDDVEAVAHACELAVEWRQTWKSDVVVDLVCYRRHGHNEIDDPMFTQPLMYKVIKAHRNSHMQYADKLVREGTVSAEEVAGVQQRVQSILEAAFDKSKAATAAGAAADAREWLAAGSHWGGFKAPEEVSRIRNTGVPMEQLLDVGRTITALPPGFTPHRAIARVYEARAAALSSGAGVDWALAEALAMGTLLREGFHVRLSGQDVERGTFSHRHAVLHDQATGARYRPLCAAGTPGLFTISNSSLSEFGVLGFELGYALESPAQLVIWEAQFGDFANGAQVMIDQFISSGETKWLRQNGLVMLLPHGYDGQGPEHSSARLERFLQMTDEDAFAIPDMEVDTRRQVQECNWQVCNITTPANYFHMLRRQLHREFRKPLVVMAPKNLLRHPQCRSDLSEFDDVDQRGPGHKDTQGTRFKRLIMDKKATDRSLTPPPAPEVKRLVFVSGKLYYELDAALEAAPAAAQAATAVVRLEQIAPFPWDLVARELRRYPNAQLVWAQEEPKNMGAFSHVLPRLQTVMKAEGRGAEEVTYAGRAAAASTATGFGSHHALEQAGLIKAALATDK